MIHILDQYEGSKEPVMELTEALTRPIYWSRRSSWFTTFLCRFPTNHDAKTAIIVLAVQVRAISLKAIQSFSIHATKTKVNFNEITAVIADQQ
jgi:hypothetical protein